jgi:RNA polymerase sigma-70 factor, ECF subfamily
VNEQTEVNGDVDQELVRRVQRGDKKAFDLLVLKYQHKIVHLVNRYVKDAAEAEDVTQDTFIKAYRALADFRGESAFYTWLYRIAINTAKNYLLTRSRRNYEYEIEVQDAEQLENAPQLKDYDTPDRHLLSEEIQRMVNEAIDGLPEEMRVAITLREYEGLSYEEIAAVMDCPIGTVRSRIFRARETIDEKLKPLLDE